jgi:hypothetical protein
MIPRDTLQLIQETAQAAKTPKLVDVPGDGRTAYVWDGAELREIAVKPPLRRHQVETLDDLVALAKAWAGDADCPPIGSPVAWHNRNRVTVVRDDAERREFATMELRFSKTLLRLADLEQDPRPMDQRQFVRLLRIELGLDTLLVAKFRKLDWQSGAATKGEVAHGRDRMGREIQAEVQGVEELPEEIDVRLAVYANPGERDESIFLVRCAVEIDAANQRFTLTPLPDEIERVIDMAQASIRNRLEEGLAEPEIAVYAGEP